MALKHIIKYLRRFREIAVNMTAISFSPSTSKHIECSAVFEMDRVIENSLLMRGLVRCKKRKEYQEECFEKKGIF